MRRRDHVVCHPSCDQRGTLRRSGSLWAQVLAGVVRGVGAPGAEPGPGTEQALHR